MNPRLLELAHRVLDLAKEPNSPDLGRLVNDLHNRVDEYEKARSEREQARERKALRDLRRQR